MRLIAHLLPLLIVTALVPCHSARDRAHATVPTVQADVPVRREDLKRIAREVLAGAPYKQFDASNGLRNQAIGRTPGATCEAIRFLTGYVTAEPTDQKARATLLGLADWVLALQSRGDGRPEYGGVPSTPDAKPPSDRYYFSIDAAFCGDAMLRLHASTGRAEYLDAARRFADFLLTMMRDSGARSFRQKRSAQGFCEYVIGQPQPVWNCRRYVKNLVALPFLRALSDLTRDSIYADAARSARAFLGPGLDGAWEFAEPFAACSGCEIRWHRISGSKEERDSFVYGDTIAYALRGLFEYEGASDQVRRSYFRFAAMKGGGARNRAYDGRIAFAGYIDPGKGQPDELSPYYDLVTLGLLHGVKRALRPDDYDLAERALVGCIMRNQKLSWQMNMDLTLPQSGWSDLSTLSSLGEALLAAPAAEAAPNVRCPGRQS